MKFSFLYRHKTIFSFQLNFQKRGWLIQRVLPTPNLFGLESTGRLIHPDLHYLLKLPSPPYPLFLFLFPYPSPLTHVCTLLQKLQRSNSEMKTTFEFLFTVFFNNNKKLPFSVKTSMRWLTKPLIKLCQNPIHSFIFWIFAQMRKDLKQKRLCKYPPLS